MLIEALLALAGLLVVAFKVVRDDNQNLKAQVEDLKLKLDLQPLNDALTKADKEVQDAKKNYDDSINPNNH